MKNSTILILILVVSALTAGGYYYWYGRPGVPSTTVGPVAGVAPSPAPRPRPVAPEYPLPHAPAAPARPPLPPLNQSDPAVWNALVHLASGEPIARLIVPKDLVHRFVVTVDGLTHRAPPARFAFFRPVAGRFTVEGTERAPVLGPANYGRYTVYVRLAEAVSTKRLIRTYIELYPLLQQEYERLGYRHRYFNDRVVAAIRSMLATPVVTGNIRLIQPKVLYQFADPRLERLPAGQKILLRMGPRNAARIKAKLSAILTALAHGALARPPAPPAPVPAGGPGTASGPVGAAPSAP
ncbi:MAG: DUF3014 domain-containing protein [Acidiferrobacteraceae bacterium]